MQKNPYLSAVVLFCGLAAAVFLLLLYFVHQMNSAESLQNELGGEVVALNRVVRLAGELQEQPGNQAIRQQMEVQLDRIQPAQLADRLNGPNLLRMTDGILLLALFLCLTFALLFYAFLRRRILRPFQRLENFAAGVAAGDFDLPLKMEQGNVFGAFTWAFDLMRVELKKAKAAEAEAKLAQKTLVATISHDIKTPVASIRAYAEALAGGTANTPERQARYLAVIQRKADEVAALTDDLFLHAISDIDRLSIELEDCAAPALFKEILEPFLVQYGGKIRLKDTVPAVAIRTDKRRLAQVLENIVANSAKYAGDSELHIAFSCADGFLVCGFEDFGGGVPPEDLPFVQEKFYRGENAKGRKGAGLGLYIARYVMEKTGGFLTLENTGRGLLVRVGVKTCGI